MTPEARHGGYSGLSRLVVIIVALATLIWCSLLGMNLLDAGFRAAVVYLMLSIASLVIKSLLLKLTEIGDEEPDRLTVRIPADNPSARGVAGESAAHPGVAR